MKSISTILMTIVFSLICFSVVSADQLLGQKIPPTKTFVLQSEGENPAEHESTETTVKLNAELINQLIEGYLINPSISQLTTSIAAAQMSFNDAMLAMTQQLSMQQRYKDLIKLSEGLSEDERIALDIQFAFARALVRQNHYEQAVDAYLALVKQEPTNQAASINLGLLLSKLERYEASQAILNHAISITSGAKKAKALSALASNYQKQADFQTAAVLFMRSIEYRPNHPATWLKLANMRAMIQQNQAEVTKTYQRALALRPDYPAASKALGQYLLQQTQFDQAIVNLKVALEHSNEDEMVHHQLAWAYLEAKQFNAALKHWTWLENHAATAEVRLLASHLKSALEQKAQQLKALSESAEHRYAKLVIAQLNQQRQAALEIIQTIPADDPFYQRCQLRQKKINSLKDA